MNELNELPFQKDQDMNWSALPFVAHCRRDEWHVKKNLIVVFIFSPTHLNHHFRGSIVDPIHSLKQKEFFQLLHFETNIIRFV